MSQRGFAAYPEWRQVLMCPDWAVHGNIDADGTVQAGGLTVWSGV